jgi:hypothetical protein
MGCGRGVKVLLVILLGLFVCGLNDVFEAFSQEPCIEASVRLLAHNNDAGFPPPPLFWKPPYYAEFFLARWATGI